MKNKTIILFILLIIVSSFLVGCGETTKVKHLSDVDNTIKETPTQETETQETNEQEIEQADDVETKEEVVNESELNNGNNITYYYDGEIIVPNIPDLENVEIRNLELRERSVENNRENHIAIAKGAILNTGKVDDSVIVVVKLYGKKFDGDEMYHTVEVEGRKKIEVPANEKVSFEFSIDYDDRVWYGYSFEFE